MDRSQLTSLRDADQKFHLHPFTHHGDMHRAGTQVVTGSSGVYVIDQDDRRLMDGLAGLWCVNVGYGRREIAEAVYKQMLEVPYYPSFFNTTTEPAVHLAEKLAAMAPRRINRTIFCNSGSEANESAVKLVRGFWKLKGKPGKYKILSRTYAYHGVGVATTSMTGLPSCYAPFDLPLEGGTFVHVPGPHHYEAVTDLDPVAYGQWCVEATRAIIDQHGAETIGAIFVEPIQGAGGVIVPPAGYLAALRQLAREKEILFVADEVITGFGRMGAPFASTLWDLDPDLMSVAKGLTSGYLPLGATLVSDEVVDVLNSGGYIAHGFTYSGHPAACAAGLANLKIIEDERLIERVRDDVGPYFQEKLRSFANHPAAGQVRGFQLIGAIELLPRSRKKEDRVATSPLGVKAAAIARRHGLIVRGIRDLIAISPPFTITRGEIDFLFDVVGKTLDELWA
jgi:putrescine aminotransferase